MLKFLLCRVRGGCKFEKWLKLHMFFICLTYWRKSMLNMTQNAKLIQHFAVNMLNVLLCRGGSGWGANVQKWLHMLTFFICWAHCFAGSHGGECHKLLNMTVFCFVHRVALWEEGWNVWRWINTSILFMNSTHCFVSQGRTFRKHNSRCHVGSYVVRALL